MGLYTWHHKETNSSLLNEVHVLDGEAYLFASEHPDPEAQKALAQSLQSNGYKVGIAEIPSSTSSTLIFSGTPGSIKPLFNAVQKRYGYRANLSITANDDGSELRIEGIRSDRNAHDIQKWVTRHRSYPDNIDITHEHPFVPPEQALHVRGITDEEAFLGLLEKTGAAQGERRDEYYGMSTIQKFWAKAMDRAQQYAGLFFMLGDAQLGVAAYGEAQRTIAPGQSGLSAFLTHPNSKEFLGFFSGSTSMFLSGLTDFPTVSKALNLFKSYFSTGEQGQYDFMRNQDLPEERISSGRLLDKVQSIIEDSGQEVLLVGGTIAGIGIWQGRNAKIIKTRQDNITTEDGTEHEISNVVLDPLTGDKARTTRFKIQDWLSGPLIGFGSFLSATIPQEGTVTQKPFIDYGALYDKAMHTPILSQALRFLEGFKDTAAMQLVSWIPGKLFGEYRKDPRKYSGIAFVIHNVGQAILGYGESLKRSAEADHIIDEFKDERALLDQNTLTPPYGQKGFENIDIEAVRAPLESIYDTNDDKSYQTHLNRYLSKIRPGSAELPTDAERYLGVKAMKRAYLDELEQERGNTWTRMRAYALFLTGNIMMSLTGERHKERENLLKTHVNLFALCDEIVAIMKEEHATAPQEVENAARFLHNLDIFEETGYGVKELMGILTAKIEGRLSSQEEELCTANTWGKVLATCNILPESTRIPDKDTLAHYRNIPLHTPEQQEVVSSTYTGLHDLSPSVAPEANLQDVEREIAGQRYQTLPQAG